MPGSLAWNYETGLILLSVLRMAAFRDDMVLDAYVRAHAEALIKPDGSILAYRKDEYNLDQINGGRLLLELASRNIDTRYAKAVAALRDQLAKQPRTASGGFWHKKIYPYQIWLDGLYMQAPFSVRYGLEYNDPELVDDACEQLVLAAEKTRDPATGLLRHAWDESRKQLWADPASGRSPHVWGRAVGWYCMALIDVLELLPQNFTKRAGLASLFIEIINAVIAHRDDETKLWFQILDQTDRPGNYPESSASAMFCYALAKAVSLHLLPAASFSDMAMESFLAIIERYCTSGEKSGFSLGGICKVAGLGGNPYRDGSFSYYISEPVVSDDFKGLGPFIMAAVELTGLSRSSGSYG